MVFGNMLSVWCEGATWQWRNLTIALPHALPLLQCDLPDETLAALMACLAGQRLLQRQAVALPGCACYFAGLLYNSRGRSSCTWQILDNRWTLVLSCGKTSDC